MKSTQQFKITSVILFLFMQILFLENVKSVHAETVYLVTDSRPGAPVQHGLNKLIGALKEKHIAVKDVKKLESVGGDILIVAGMGKGKGAAALLHRSLNIKPPKEKESLIVQNTKWNKKKVLLVSGADDRVLMYGLLYVPDRINWAKDKKKPFEP